MDVLRVFGIFSVVPATMLITASFFVMFTISKIKKSSLRIFGMVAVALLLIAACIVFSTGLSIIAQEAEYPGCRNMDKSRRYTHSSMMQGTAGMMMNPHSGMMQNKGMEQPMRQKMMDQDMSGQK